jgi:hypothetical protein
MTDLPASWQTDPTGRHDHRYWDGQRWTEHVADAGVASVDPYEEPAPEPAAPETAVAETAAPEASAAVEPAAPGPAGAGLATGWAAPRSEPEPQVAPEPAADAPTQGEPEPALGARPTWSGPEAVEDALAPTSSVPSPGAMGPEVELATGEGGGRSRTRRNLLVAGVLVLVVAIVAVLAIRGDDDDSSRGAIKTRIVDSLTSDSDAGIGRKQAECIADKVIDDVGADRLADVDFDADEVPGGDVGADLERAYVSALGSCSSDGSSADDGSTGSTRDSSDTSDGERATDGGSIADQLGGLSHGQLKEQLVSQYEAMGLTHEKADCLAEEMATALEKDGTGSNDVFSDFFDYLDDCDVSLDELGGTATTSSP